MVAAGTGNKRAEICQGLRETVICSVVSCSGWEVYPPDRCALLCYQHLVAVNLGTSQRYVYHPENYVPAKHSVRLSCITFHYNYSRRPS